MITILINGRTCDVPESFQEFSEADWELFTRGLCDFRTRSWDDVKIYYVQRKFKLPVRKINKLAKSKHPEDQKLHEDIMSRILLVTEKLLFFEIPEGIRVSANFFHKAGRGIFHRPMYGPNAIYSNIDLFEFSIAETAMIKYSNTNSVDDLNAFFAGLYRFRRPFWSLLRRFGFYPDDCRRKFHDSDIAYYQRKAARVAPFIKIFTFMAFQSVCSKLPEMFPDLYKKKSDTPEHTSWAELIVAFAGTVPGDEDKVGRANYQWVMLRMNAIAKEAERLEELNSQS